MKFATELLKFQGGPVAIFRFEQNQFDISFLKPFITRENSANLFIHIIVGFGGSSGML